MKHYYALFLNPHLSFLRLGFDQVLLFLSFFFLLLRILQMRFPRDILPVSGLTRAEIFLRYLCVRDHFVMSRLILICIFYRSHHQKLILL